MQNTDAPEFFSKRLLLRLFLTLSTTRAVIADGKTVFELAVEDRDGWKSTTFIINIK